MGNQQDDSIIHRTLDTEQSEPVVQVAEIIASLEGKDVDELTTTYEKLDHLLTNVFNEPPEPEAQVKVTFSYEGYRITVEQDGSAQFVKTKR